MFYSKSMKEWKILVIIIIINILSEESKYHKFTFKQKQTIKQEIFSYRRLNNVNSYSKLNLVWDYAKFRL